MTTKHLLVAGLAAGAVLGMLDGIINIRLAGIYGIYGRAWLDADARLGVQPSSWAVGGFWAAMCFVSGILQVWLYSVAAPRLGATVQTALITGLFVWFFTHMAVFGDLVAGVFPATLIVPVCALELVTTLIASWVGQRLYARLLVNT